MEIQLPEYSTCEESGRRGGGGGGVGGGGGSGGSEGGGGTRTTTQIPLRRRSVAFLHSSVSDLSSSS